MVTERREAVMRFQYPLYKVFLIMAVYALAFGAFSFMGATRIVVGAMIGTAGSGVILAIQDRKP